MSISLFMTVFGTVLLAELGDKTQLATMLYASEAQSSKFTVFVAASLALVLSTAIAVLLGAQISQYVEPRVLSFVAGIGFISVGVWTILQTA
ncbi:MAG: TMEM165/GDT1 family protein [Pseudomonadota bacterium]